MLKKLAILNPNANSKQTASLRPVVERALAAHNVELVLTQRQGHAVELADAAARDGYTTIIAIGGDGTLSEVANGIMLSGKSPAMGIVGAGSGNDYAHYTLGLPKDPRAALQIALTGVPRSIDLARINNSYFQNTFGVGLDANVAWDVAENLQHKTPVRGSLLYTVSALRQIFWHYSDLPVLTVKIDNLPPFQERVILGATGVGPTGGGGYRLNPQANAFDGYLDFCLARPMPRAKALVALQLLRNGKHTLLPEISLHRCRTIHLQSDTPVNAHIDGELIRGTEWQVEIVPGALQVILPHSHPAHAASGATGAL